MYLACALILAYLPNFSSPIVYNCKVCQKFPVTVQQSIFSILQFNDIQPFDKYLHSNMNIILKLTSVCKTCRDTALHSYIDITDNVLHICIKTKHVYTNFEFHH